MTAILRNRMRAPAGRSAPVPRRGRRSAWLVVLLPLAACEGSGPPTDVSGDGFVLNVGIEASGAGFDLNGYDVILDGGQPVHVSWPGASMSFENLSGPYHDVVLWDVAENCDVAGANPRTLDLGVYGETTFAVACSVAMDATIAFTETFVDAPYHSISVLTLPDAAVTSLGVQGFDAAWSPDGARLAYARTDCRTPYYILYCDRLGIAVMDYPGGDPIALTSGEDHHPSWGPDGGAIMFERGGSESVAGFYTVDVDGTGEAKIPLPPEVKAASEPVWSPDGGRLAFSCSVDSSFADICIANIDGTGLVRLTTGYEAEEQPAWSPDGTRIAFRSWEFVIDKGPEVAVINVDGTGLIRLHPGMNPVWSPDGERVLFESHWPTWPTDTFWGGVWTVRADGSDTLALTDAANQYTPAWRPDSPIPAAAVPTPGQRALGGS